MVITILIVLFIAVVLIGYPMYFSFRPMLNHKEMFETYKAETFTDKFWLLWWNSLSIVFIIISVVLLLLGAIIFFLGA